MSTILRLFEAAWDLGYAQVSIFEHDHPGATAELRAFVARKGLPIVEREQRVSGRVSLIVRVESVGGFGGRTMTPNITVHGIATEIVDDLLGLA